MHFEYMYQKHGLPEFKLYDVLFLKLLLIARTKSNRSGRQVKSSQVK